MPNRDPTGPKNPFPPGHTSSGETESATQLPRRSETPIATSRGQRGRTSTGAIARTASRNGLPPPERGSSNRSQFTAITSAARPESAAVLSIRDPRERLALEAGGQIVAGAYDRHREPRWPEAAAALAPGVAARR